MTLAATTDHRIKTAILDRFERAGPSGLAGDVLCHQILQEHMIGGHTLTALMCDLALRRKISYKRTETGFNDDVVVLCKSAPTACKAGQQTHTQNRPEQS